MPFHFCSQCGTKLQPNFKFCPSCGEKLPCAADVSSSVNSTTSTVSPSKKEEAATSLVRPSLASARSCESTEICSYITSTPSPARPALRKTRKSLCLDNDVKFNVEYPTQPEESAVGFLVSPPKQQKVTFQPDPKVEPSSFVNEKMVQKSASSPVKVQQYVRGKAKLYSPVKQMEERTRLMDKTSGKAEGSTVDDSPVAALSPVSSPMSRSPVKGKIKAKRAKHSFPLVPLQEGEGVTDTTGKKWKLMKLLGHSTTKLIYEVSQSNSKESNHILQLGTKDGRIYNEQNFLQRAAKPASVEKWNRQNKMDFLGIPSCVGFGLHADSYRFLIFPVMGQSLQSVIEEEDEFLSEKDVLQLACRILDVLQYIHSNEYVHADINAENIYIKQGQKSLIYLVGYCLAFRYCPGGQHVEYREASRTPHEGNIEFISLDAHRGAAPSRRSDLQSLGYCMLRWHTGLLPWTSLTQPEQVAAQKQRYVEDVPALLSHCFGSRSVSHISPVGAFETYLTAVMALQYSEQPDYSTLKAGLSAALLQLGGSLQLPLSFSMQ